MKEEIRRNIIRRRDKIPPDVKRLKDFLIKKRLFPLSEFADAASILLYASFRSEVDTLDLIRESLEMDKQVVLPKVDRERHTLTLYCIRELTELTAGYMGIPEPFPNADRLRSMDDIDLAVIPGAGFDISGNRLGYGAGYYDILLSGCKKKMPIAALAYEEQIVNSIPAEPHDVRVDLIVTDQRVIRIP